MYISSEFCRNIVEIPSSNLENVRSSHPKSHPKLKHKMVLSVRTPPYISRVILSIYLNSIKIK